MDIANSCDFRQPSIEFFDRTILDSTQVSNLKDRYVLGEQLGWGQFGVIRACSDKSTREVLACKSIAKDRLVTLDDVRSVKLEIEIMTRLSGHPNIVGLKAVHEDENYVHLVMELCAGGELFHQLEKHGKFSEYDAQLMFRHLMQVVQYCHENGIVHRDLKPENILLATTSTASPIKLADFGLATYIKPGESLHGTVGSPFYIAPEVLLGGYSEAADVWSAGVILYILLSGIPPFWGKTKSKIFDAVRAADLQFPSDQWDQVSASAKELITGMLCVDPYKRLNAAQVLAHSWMKDCSQAAQVPVQLDNLSCRQQDVDGSSFLTSVICRNEDYRFSNGSHTTGDDQLGLPPAFTCKSSFSSFLVEDDTTCYASGDFSFSSLCKSGAIEYSSPLLSIPSFTFFSPSSEVEDVSLGFKTKASSMDGVHKDSLLSMEYEMGKMQHKTEIQNRGNNRSRILGVHNKRNHTIGFGELGLIVTESVIRWASCTHLPTSPALRSSLVC